MEGILTHIQPTQICEGKKKENCCTTSSVWSESEGMTGRDLEGGGGGGLLDGLMMPKSMHLPPFHHPSLTLAKEKSQQQQIFLTCPPNHQRWYAKWKLSRDTYTFHACFLHVRADLRAPSVLINKISVSELRRKFIKSELLVGHAPPSPLLPKKNLSFPALFSSDLLSFHSLFFPFHT